MSEIKTQLEECGVCHSLHPMEELAAFDDTLVCPECMEDTTAVCGRCGERIWIEDDAGNEGSGHLCQSCYDRPLMKSMNVSVYPKMSTSNPASAQ